MENSRIFHFLFLNSSFYKIFTANCPKKGQFPRFPIKYLFGGGNRWFCCSIKTLDVGTEKIIILFINYFIPPYFFVFLNPWFNINFVWIIMKIFYNYTNGFFLRINKFYLHWKFSKSTTTEQQMISREQIHFFVSRTETHFWGRVFHNQQNKVCFVKRYRFCFFVF